MTYREMNLAVFRGEPLPHVFFQPRFEPWLHWNKQFDSLPPECVGKDVREVYDDVDASMRYPSYYTGQPHPVTTRFASDVKIETTGDDKQRIVAYHTPHGTLTETKEFTVDREWRVTQHMGKRVEDLAALTWLMERIEIEFDAKAFQQGQDFIGERGVGQFYVPKSPYFALAQVWMDFEAFMYSLYDEPQQIAELMEIIDRSYDVMYRQLTEAKITPIINFGENMAEAYLSPAYFEQHFLPWHEKRVGELRSAGIFTHIHIDGFFKSLIPSIRKLPHDALEALTPLPQGDVTLDEMEEALNGKILLDGIPAILYIAPHTRDQLQESVEQVIARFHPKLVLGISDELPQAGDAESYERLKWTARYAKSVK